MMSVQSEVFKPSTVAVSETKEPAMKTVIPSKWPIGAKIAAFAGLLSFLTFMTSNLGRCDLFPGQEFVKSYAASKGSFLLLKKDVNNKASRTQVLLLKQEVQGLKATIGKMDKKMDALNRSVNSGFRSLERTLQGRNQRSP